MAARPPSRGAGGRSRPLGRRVATEPAPAWRTSVGDEIWELWETDPAQVAVRAAEAERRQREAEEARVARGHELLAELETQLADSYVRPGRHRAIAGEDSEDGSSDSDDVDPDDEDVPVRRRGSTLRYGTAGEKPGREPLAKDDACMLECYAGMVGPRPQDWPPEPSLAQRFYGLPPAWLTNAESGELQKALQHSPFGLLPEEVLHIVVLFIESPTLLGAMPAVCRFFGVLSRREGLWRNVCRIRGWGMDVEGVAANSGAAAVGSAMRKACRPPIRSRGRPWWETTRRWTVAMTKTKALYDELLAQPGATAWEDLDDDEVRRL